MRSLILLIFALSLFRCAPSKKEPGFALDSLSSFKTPAQLRAAFGADNVSFVAAGDTVYHLFKDSPNDVSFLIGSAPGVFTSFFVVGNSQWKTRVGLKIGMTLQEADSLNQKKFFIQPEDGAALIDDGNLKSDHIAFSFANTTSLVDKADPSVIYDSREPALIKVKPVISRIVYHYGTTQAIVNEPSDSNESVPDQSDAPQQEGEEEIVDGSGPDGPAPSEEEEAGTAPEDDLSENGSENAKDDKYNRDMVHTTPVLKLPFTLDTVYYNARAKARGLNQEVGILSDTTEYYTMLTATTNEFWTTITIMNINKAGRLMNQSEYHLRLVNSYYASTKDCKTIFKPWFKFTIGKDRHIDYREQDRYDVCGKVVYDIYSMTGVIERKGVVVTDKQVDKMRGQPKY